MGPDQHRPPVPRASGLEVLREAERRGILGAHRAIDGHGVVPGSPDGQSYMRVRDDREPPEWFVGVVERAHRGVREFWSWADGARMVRRLA